MMYFCLILLSFISLLAIATASPLNRHYRVTTAALAQRYTRQPEVDSEHQQQRKHVNLIFKNASKFSIKLVGDWVRWGLIVIPMVVLINYPPILGFFNIPMEQVGMMKLGTAICITVALILSDSSQRNSHTFSKALTKSTDTIAKALTESTDTFSNALIITAVIISTSTIINAVVTGPRR